MGLGGEASEVFEKAVTGAFDELPAELGDVLWYLSRFHRELGRHPLDTLVAAGVAPTRCDNPAGDLIIATGRVLETVKKAIRDEGGFLSDGRRVALVEQLTVVLGAWLRVHEMYRLDPAVTARANTAKLADRQRRGVLAGSGDRR